MPLRFTALVNIEIKLLYVIFCFCYRKGKKYTYQRNLWRSFHFKAYNDINTIRVSSPTHFKIYFRFQFEIKTNGNEHHNNKNKCVVLI